MSAKPFGLMVAVVLVSSIGIACAGEPMAKSSTGIASKGQPVALTDAQLDRVTAGVAVASVDAFAEGGVVSGSFLLDALNLSPTEGSAEAAISATLIPQGIPPHTLSVAAFAFAP